MKNRNTGITGQGRLRCAAQYTAVLFLTVVLLSGCGKEEQLSNTKQGMNAVEALQYEEALAHFQAALEKGEDVRTLYRGMGLADRKSVV